LRSQVTGGVIRVEAGKTVVNFRGGNSFTLLPE
jgi:hypothetical protein